MGTAACKSSKSVPLTQPKDVNKNITIGVFGLDDAGKTSTVKAIDGDPTDDTTPTIGSFSTMVNNPLQKKNINEQRVKIIDVSGERRYRQKSWSQYYEQIHGWIFVIDASDRQRLNENQEILEDLLNHEQLKDKPVLILANKQDQKNAVNKEQDLKRQLNIERLKAKYKISKVDDSIRNGFSWLIRTIDENYTTLNSRITKSTKGSSFNRKSHRSDSDDNENINPYSREKSTGPYHSKITSEKLPSINTKKTTGRFNSDDDNDEISSMKSELNKKKKLTGTINNNNNSRLTNKSKENEPKAFRATFESFPEETPWSLSNIKTTKTNTTLPKLYTKPSSTYDSKRRDISPLIHDTKSYTNPSTFKRDNQSDDDDDYLKQKSKSTTNRFTMNTKKPGYSTYDDEDISRRIITATKKTYNDNDDDDNDYYLKKSSNTTFRKNNDLDDYKSYSRSSKSKYNDDDDDDDDDEKEDHHRWSSSRTGTTNSKYNNRSEYDHDNRFYSSSKPTSHSKFEDDDYPTNNRSNYNGKTYPTTSSRFEDDNDNQYRPSSSLKPVTHSKYSDDDDDDYYSNSTRKNNYTNRSRSNHDDFFTSKGESTMNSRFKTTSGYDS